MSVVIFSHGHFNVMIYVAIPYCQSTNTSKISVVDRVVSTGLFGLGSNKVGKQYHCNKCGSNF